MTDSSPTDRPTAVDRRSFLKHGSGLMVGLLSSCGRERDPFEISGQATTRPLPSTLRQPNGVLRDLAAGNGILFGASTKKPFIVDDPMTLLTLSASCAMIVPEVEQHWDFVSPSATARDYANMDWMVRSIEDSKRVVRGHALVWGTHVPEWVYGLSIADSRLALIRYVTDIVRRYRGRLYSWDVVNEPLEPWDGRADGLRKTKLLAHMGRDFIEDAFFAAREGDPDVLLVLNEYGFEYETPPSLLRRSSLLKLVDSLKDAGAPIGGVGLQSHLKGGDKRFDATSYRAFLAELASRDLQLLVTELDVEDKALPRNFAERDRIVADCYREYLDVVLDEPAVKVVNTWGLSDRYTWLERSSPRDDGALVRSLPLDVDFRPKPAWDAMAAAFAAAPSR